MIACGQIADYSGRGWDRQQIGSSRQERTLMDRTVGMIGLGIMGSAIARNLVERGWRVIGFDIDAARCAELALAGVAIAENTAQVARDAQIIMTSLSNPGAVGDVAAAIARSG